MFDVPKRLSLVAQAAAAIRTGIDENLWQKTLPSERRLCELLKISRPTVRKALHLLARENTISLKQGQRHRVISRKHTAAVPPSRLIVIVSHEHVSMVPDVGSLGITEVQTHLNSLGFVTEFFVCPLQSPAAQRRHLEQYLQKNRVFCCILLSVNQSLHAWFAARQLPAVVLGSCHPSVHLPSLDVDYRAVCRSAGGYFLSKGHRRIALLIPDTDVAGDRASEEGFLESVAQRGDDAEAKVIRHDGTSKGLTSKLDILLNSSRPPSALMVAKPRHAVIALIHLLKRGHNLPDTISLIARDQDDLLTELRPQVAHFRYEGNLMAQKLGRLLEHLWSEGKIAPEPYFIFPRFVPGGSVKNLG